MSTPEFRDVHRCVNKPLTICGAERKLFFLATILGAATFSLFASLLGGMLMFLALFLFARWATATDPQILRILLNSAKFRGYYDPAKRGEPTEKRGVFRA